MGVHRPAPFVARRALAVAVVLALAPALALAGCIAPQDTAQDDRNDATSPPPSSDESCLAPDVTPTATPGGQVSVSNNPGSFSYGGQVAAKTGKEVYVWENPTRAAQVAWGGQSAAGTLTLVIQETCGEEVYRADLGGPRQGGAYESTQEGESGKWIITLEFTLYTGQMGLSVNSA